MKTRAPAISRFAIYVPLLLHIVPTLVIGLGFVIMQSCIAGANPLSIGFVATVLGFIPTYLAGGAIARRAGSQLHA